MAQLIFGGNKPTNRGEVKLQNYLREKLPEDWIILGNPIIPDKDLSREVDCLVIGSGYIWVIDSKAINGVIRGDESEWIFANNKSRPYPLNGVIMAAKRVAGKINAPGASYGRVFVKELVVITSDNFTLAVQDDRLKHMVLPLAGLEKALLNPKYKIRPTPLTPEHRREIVRRLVGDRAARQVVFPSAGLPEQEKITSLHLTGAENFFRVYYSDEMRTFLLGHQQLRGAHPQNAWDNLANGGVRVTFLDETIGLEVVPGTGRVMVNGRFLEPGQKRKLRQIKGEIDLTGIRLNYEISSFTLP